MHLKSGFRIVLNQPLIGRFNLHSLVTLRPRQYFLTLSRFTRNPEIGNTPP